MASRPHAISISALTLTLCSLLLGLSALPADAGQVYLRVGADDPLVIETPPLRIQQREGARIALDCEDALHLGQAGQPDIPWFVTTVLLPPHADLATVAAYLDTASYDTVEGVWDLAPAPPLASWDEQGQPVIDWPQGREIRQGYDVELYHTDSLWPGLEARVVHTGGLGDWQLAEIALPLARYNPVSGELRELASCELNVEYAPAAGPSAAPLPVSTQGQDRVAQLAINYSAAATSYMNAAADLQPAPAPGTGYVIITTSSIVNGSSRLDDFVAHKQARGFNVQVRTEAHWGGGTGQAAYANIRAWLQNHYISDNIEYVLLIGNPHPDSGDVPMCLYNDRADDLAPTDSWYADLDGSTWDKYWEVIVGRIPFYGSISDLDGILLKTINYENASSTNWRRNVITSMVPLDDSTPSYQCGEQIKYNQLEPRGVFSSRIYDETYNLWPSPEYDRSYNNQMVDVWNSGDYGMVVWQTHGSQTSASHVMSTSHVSSLDNARPAATYQGSCQNAWPENSGNLAYRILRNGGITTVAATRNSWYYVGESNFTTSGSIGSLAYRYTRNCANGESCGLAISNAKQQNGMLKANVTRMVLYGDPSATVFVSEPEIDVYPTETFAIHKAQAQTWTRRTYTLLNQRATTMNWSASSNVDWVSFSPASGAIAADGSGDVTVYFNDSANLLPPGAHTAVISFTGHSTVQQRIVKLNVDLQGMLGHWQFDEGAGSVAYDLSGSGRNASLINMDAADWIAGRDGGALAFDGIDDYLQAPGLNLHGDSITITGWVRRIGDQGPDGLVFNREYGMTNGLNFSGNELRYHWRDAQSTWNWSSGLIVPNATWTFVALVIQPHRATIYMQDGSGMHTATRADTHTPAAWQGPLVLAWDPLGDRYFKGALDDVRIYNYAADAAGIERIFLGGDIDITPPTPDPLTWDQPPAALSQDEITMTASLANDVSGVQYYFECTAGPGHDSGWQAQRTYTDSDLEADTEYSYRVKARDGSLNGNETASSEPLAATTLPEQWPFGDPAVAPGVIQAEDFDEGGQGYACFDSSTGNSGGQYRTSEDVDIISVPSGDFAVWTSNGEWLEYTLDVPDAGWFELTARLACGYAGRSFRVLLDGDLLTTVTVPVTGGMNTYQDTTALVPLPAGPRQILRVEIITGGFSLDRLAFTTVDPCAASQAQPGYTPLPGDLNQDCHVDAADLATLAGDWLTPYNLADYAALADAWLQNSLLE